MAITTLFDGIEFRSRLEARWASFFRRIGWEFTYEPFDGDGYIPDFLIHGAAPLLVEVKPAATEGDYRAPLDKITDGLADHWQHDILVVGASPLPFLPVTSWGAEMPAAGLLGEFLGEVNGSPEWSFDAGLWFRCANCRQVAIFHEVMTYKGRPCGCYEGDHFLWMLDEPVITAAWSQACNDVKWRGRAA